MPGISCGVQRKGTYGTGTRAGTWLYDELIKVSFLFGFCFIFALCWVIFRIYIPLHLSINEGKLVITGFGSTYSVILGKWAPAEFSAYGFFYRIRAEKAAQMHYGRNYSQKVLQVIIRTHKRGPQFMEAAIWVWAWHGLLWFLALLDA